MTKVGLILFKEVGKKKSAWARIVERKLTVPADLKKALAKDKKAMKNFDNFAPSYKKMYIWWIEAAKKRETEESNRLSSGQNRIKNLVCCNPRFFGKWDIRYGYNKNN